MNKLIYLIALSQQGKKPNNALGNLVDIVRHSDMLDYSIYFNEETAINASQHISYNTIIACAYVDESHIAYHADRLIINAPKFDISQIHGHFPNKNNLGEYLTNPFFNTELTHEPAAIA